MTIPTTSLIASASVLLASTMAVQAGPPGGYPGIQVQPPAGGAYAIHPGAPAPQGNSATPFNSYDPASDDDDPEDSEFNIGDDEDEGDEIEGVGLSLDP